MLARVYDPWFPKSEKQALEDPKTFESAVDAQAKQYVDLFVKTYDSLKGGGRSYAAIVASASEENEEMLEALRRGGGRMSELEELEYAIRKRDADAVKAILRRQRTGKDVQALVDDYEHKYPDRNLRETLFGMFGVEVAERHATKKWGLGGGFLGARDAASAEESLEKPERLGGEAEVDWIAKHGQREVEVTEANSGFMGSLRELGDDPETQVIMNESAARLRALQAEWKRSDPWGPRRPRQQILAEMRHVRAALTGDASAYEAENERMVAELRSAVSFVVQIALAVALPGVGTGFLATAALNIGATVASNMIIYGDEYDLTSFRNDVLGGGLGALGGEVGKRGFRFGRERSLREHGEDGGRSWGACRTFHRACERPARPPR